MYFTATGPKHSNSRFSCITQAWFTTLSACRSCCTGLCSSFSSTVSYVEIGLTSAVLLSDMASGPSASGPLFLSRSHQLWSDTRNVYAPGSTSTDIPSSPNMYALACTNFTSRSVKPQDILSSQVPSFSQSHLFFMSTFIFSLW